MRVVRRTEVNKNQSMGIKHLRMNDKCEQKAQKSSKVQEILLIDFQAGVSADISHRISEGKLVVKDAC